MPGAVHTPRPHDAATVAAQLGTSLRAICRGHKVARSALYLALQGKPWARDYVRRRLGAELATLVLGEAPS